MTDRIAELVAHGELKDKLIQHIIRWLNSNIDDPPMGSIGVCTESADLKEKIDLYLEGIDEF